MLSALAVMAIWQTNPLARPINYETRGKEIRAILADLSRESGVSMTCSGMADTPAIVRVKSMPLRRLMDELAEVADAEWQVKEGKHELVRTQSRRLAAREAEIRERTERIRRWLKETAKVDEPLRGWSDADIEAANQENAKAALKTAEHYSEAVTADAVTPGRIVLIDFLRKCKAEVIGGLLPGDTLVYSTDPVWESPMPVDLSRAIDLAVQARDRASQLLKSDPRAFTPAGVMTNASLVSLPVRGKVSATAVLHRRGGRVSAEVYLLADRKVIDYSGLTLSFSAESLVEPPAGLEGPVVLTKHEQAMAQSSAYASFEFPDWGGDIKTLLPADLRDILKDPVRNDPVSFLPATWLRQTTEKLGANLVAFVSDPSVVLILEEFRSQPNLPQLWRNQRKLGVSLKVEDGLLTAVPTNRAAADRGRINRAALGALVASYSEARYPTWSELLKYSEAMPVIFSDNNLDFRWMKLLDPNGRAFAPVGNAAMIRFIDSLGLPAKQPRLQKDLAELTKEQLATLQLATNFKRSYSPRYLGTRLGGSLPREYSVEVPAFRTPTEGFVIIESKQATGAIASFTSGAFVAMTDDELKIARNIRGRTAMTLTNFSVMVAAPGSPYTGSGWIWRVDVP